MKIREGEVHARESSSARDIGLIDRPVMSPTGHSRALINSTSSRFSSERSGSSSQQIDRVHHFDWQASLTHAVGELNDTASAK